MDNKMPGFKTHVVADIIFQSPNRMTACYAESLRVSGAVGLLKKFHHARIAFDPPPRSLLQAEAELLHVGFHRDDVRAFIDTWYESTERYAQNLQYAHNFSGFPEPNHFDCGYASPVLVVNRDSLSLMGYKTLRFENTNLLRDPYFKGEIREHFLLALDNQFRDKNQPDDKPAILWADPDLETYEL
jgi:hypothetical protein